MATEKKRLMSELAPSPHLEAADLDGDLVLTIKAWDRHEVGPEKQMKAVIYFEEVERGLVVNKTNRVILQHLFGRYVDDMVGQKVALYATECQFQGKLVPCLRIRSEHPAVSSMKIAGGNKEKAIA
jgi:hypothetical protein